MDAFIGHPDGIPESDVRHAATRSAGSRKPVNIRNAVRSNVSVRRVIAVCNYVITQVDDSEMLSYPLNY
jgi:hypothetical protein